MCKSVLAPAASPLDSRLRLKTERKSGSGYSLAAATSSCEGSLSPGQLEDACGEVDIAVSARVYLPAFLFLPLSGDSAITISTPAQTSSELQEKTSSVQEGLLAQSSAAGLGSAGGGFLSGLWQCARVLAKAYVALSLGGSLASGQLSPPMASTPICLSSQLKQVQYCS